MLLWLYGPEGPTVRVFLGRSQQDLANLEEHDDEQSQLTG